jgi:hypothetical protein
LSVYGAFIGADRAKAFFNGIPAAIYWIGFILLLALGIALFGRLRRVPALLMTHIGCICILAGAMWGSEPGHKMRKQILGDKKVPAGLMYVYEGHLENRVQLEDNNKCDLPFYIGLKDFRIEYYQPQYLYIQNQQGKIWKCPVKPGAEYELGKDTGSIKILKVFENFKISIDGNKRTVTDEPDSGYNAALEVQIKSPDGRSSTRYVFEKTTSHTDYGDGLILAYQRTVKDYISELQVIKNDKYVAHKNVEVNHPLHYGGYHFYQQSYDNQKGQFTILRVVSDSGLWTVYCGYTLLCGGIIWLFWLKNIPAWLNKPKYAKSKGHRWK